MNCKVAWLGVLGIALMIGSAQGATKPEAVSKASVSKAVLTDKAPAPLKKTEAAKPKIAPEDEPVQEATDSAAVETSAPPDSGNPYDIIIDRNIFRLNPAPPPQPPPAPPPPDIPTIKISGFSETGGSTTAFFATVPKDPKELPTYFALSDKVKQVGILELVKIHPGQEEVDVLVNGIPVTLSVKSNSFVQPIAVASKVPGGPGGQPGGMIPRPGMPNSAVAHVPGAMSPIGNPGGGYGGNAGGNNGPIIAGRTATPGENRIPVAGGYNPPANNGMNTGFGQANMNVNGQTSSPNAIPIPQRPSRIPPSYPPEVPSTYNGNTPPPIPGQ